MRLRNFFKFLSAITLAAPLAAHAATNATDIKHHVKLFIDQYQQQLIQRYPDASSINHKIAALDSRVAMSDCDNPLQVERKDNNDIGRINLKVSCDSPQKWSLYVPTHIRVLHPIVVSSSPINKNTRLMEHHLSLNETDISRIRGSYYFHVKDVIGMETKRPIKPGSAITSNHLRPPLVVNKGDAVVLTASIGSLSVKTPAIALTPGRQGQQIRVQNKQSKKIVDARVTGPGAVKATL